MVAIVESQRSLTRKQNEICQGYFSKSFFIYSDKIDAVLL